MSVQEIAEIIKGKEADLIELRHELHQMPEIGLDLPETQARLLKALEPYPLEISTGTKTTSITAVLRGKAPLPDGTRRPVILLRGDMDGLPVEEQAPVEYKSTNGNMHGCGHDMHMTVVMGAVHALCEKVDELVADVVFMFQPGEEGYSGGQVMIDEGVLDAAGQRVDEAYALHVFSAGFPGGLMLSKAGPMAAASDNLRVKVIGTGGHGSAPHSANDPVPVACEMVQAIQTVITRRFDVFDPAVVSVGVLKAGSALNVIAESAYFEATVRSFSHETQDRLFELLPQVVHGIAAAHGMRAEVEMEKLYPPTINDAACYDRTRQMIEELFGEQRFLEPPTPMMGSEDFSFVLQQVPGCFFGLSAVPAGQDPTTQAYNHSPLAVYDDAVIVDGAAVLAGLAYAAEPIKQ